MILFHICARALIVSRVAQFVLKIAKHELRMELRGPHAYGLSPRMQSTLLSLMPR